MDVTVIKVGYSIRQIIFGKPTEQIEKWVKELNDNPLLGDEATIEEKYTDKSIYNVAEFLGLD